MRRSWVAGQLRRAETRFPGKKSQFDRQPHRQPHGRQSAARRDRGTGAGKETKPHFLLDYAPPPIISGTQLERFGFMNMTDELERLSQLHKDGTLSDEEFAQAKSKLLSQPSGSEPAPPDNSLGEAANRYVTFRIVMGVIGIFIFLIFLFGVILPSMNHNHPVP